MELDKTRYDRARSDGIGWNLISLGLTGWDQMGSDRIASHGRHCQWGHLAPSGMACAPPEVNAELACGEKTQLAQNP